MLISLRWWRCSVVCLSRSAARRGPWPMSARPWTLPRLLGLHGAVTTLILLSVALGACWRCCFAQRDGLGPWHRAWAGWLGGASARRTASSFLRQPSSRGSRHRGRDRTADAPVYGAVAATWLVQRGATWRVNSLILHPAEGTKRPKRSSVARRPDSFVCMPPEPWCRPGFAVRTEAFLAHLTRAGLSDSGGGCFWADVNRSTA